MRIQLTAQQVFNLGESVTSWLCTLTSAGEHPPARTATAAAVAAALLTAQRPNLNKSPLQDEAGWKLSCPLLFLAPSRAEPGVNKTHLAQWRHSDGFDGTKPQAGNEKQRIALQFKQDKEKGTYVCSSIFTSWWFIPKNKVALNYGLFHKYDGKSVYLSTSIYFVICD